MGIELLEVPEIVVSHCPLYKVIIKNDDITPMQFVVWVLVSIYKMELERATEVMLLIHNTGQGIAGVFPLEIAELKVEQTHSAARTDKYPLTCIIEKA